MNRLFRRLVVFSAIPVFPVYPAAPTFVSSSGMSSGGTTSTPSTPSALQQIRNIFAQPITQEAPTAPSALPLYATARGAAEALQEIRRTQYSRMIKQIGTLKRYEKEAEQAELMRRERSAIQQLTTRFGIPSRLIPQYK